MHQRPTDVANVHTIRTKHHAVNLALLTAAGEDAADLRTTEPA